MSFIRSSLVFGLVAASTPSFADPCFQLSADGVNWSRTPETLCIEVVDPAQDPTDWERVRITLTIEEMFRPRTVATFDLDHQMALGTTVIYEIANPSNSLFNDLAIQLHFSAPGASDGRAQIGQNEFYFRAAP